MVLLGVWLVMLPWVHSQGLASGRLDGLGLSLHGVSGPLPQVALLAASTFFSHAALSSPKKLTWKLPKFLKAWITWPHSIGQSKSQDSQMPGEQTAQGANTKTMVHWGHEHDVHLTTW